MSLESSPDRSFQPGCAPRTTGPPRRTADSSVERIEQVLAAIDEAIQGFDDIESHGSALEQRLVFIDSRVEDVEAHLRHISEATLYWIDEETDGVAEIGKTLSTYQWISEVHIVAPAWKDRLSLGTVELGPDLQSAPPESLIRWSRPMTPASQIIVHGGAADSEAATDVLLQLADLTGIRCVAANVFGSLPTASHKASPTLAENSAASCRDNDKSSTDFHLPMDAYADAAAASDFELPSQPPATRSQPDVE